MKQKILTSLLILILVGSASAITFSETEVNGKQIFADDEIRTFQGQGNILVKSYSLLDIKDGDIETTKNGLRISGNLDITVSGYYIVYGNMKMIIEDVPFPF
jgi:hypothetical protein